MMWRMISRCAQALAFIVLTDVQGFALTTMEFVTVGDPGNPANMIVKKGDESTGYGSVDYIFRIGKYETTNQQYSDFLNAVAASDPNALYDWQMGNTVWGGIARSGVNGSYSYSVLPHMGNKPVNFVSGYDVARFANWLHNGQPIGAQTASTTENGAYTMSGMTTEIIRNPGAKFFIPTEHEWEKAAYYNPGGGRFGSGWNYYTHGVGTVFPTAVTIDAFGNVTNPSQTTVNFSLEANWNGATRGNVTTVGSAGSVTHYGAYDTTGNVFEWTVADPTKPDPNGWGPFTVRGGSFTNEGHATNDERNMVHHDNHSVVRQDVGFRLAAAYIDPSGLNIADFNQDTFVDGDDLLVWQQSFGVDEGGDADGDGFTDGNDFLIWQRNLASDNNVASVPEPTAWALAWTMSVSLLALRRRSPIS
jgi:formylglycine-generating enzyme